MAPIEPDLSNSNLRPLSIFGGYLLLASALVGFVSYDVLYKAYRALPPSQDTRHRQPSRERHVQLFAVLATLSLATTWYYMFSYFTLSYRVWAHEMGKGLPVGLWSQGGIFEGGQLRLALGRWLSDTSLFWDAWEIVIERSKRYWWSQQTFLGAAAWSVFVGIEGRRRNIRHLWAFLLLGETIAISVALNLFFMAVLLTPVPLPRAGQKQIEDSTSTQKHPSSASSTTILEPSDKTQSPMRHLITTLNTLRPPNILRPHPPEWKVHPLAIIAPLATLTICVIFLPFSTSTPQFAFFLLIPHLVLFQPVYIDRLAPIAYGSTKHPHRTYLSVYRFLSYASFLLYLKQTFVALLDNDPGAHDHRHSHYLALLHLPHSQERGGLRRTTSSFGAVLGALADHPAVASVGWDVLMCGLSLAAWAVVRGLDVTRIASAAGLTTATTTSEEKESGSRKTSKSTSTTGATPNDKPPRRRRKSAATSKSGDGEFLPSRDDEQPILRGEEERSENLEAGAVSWAMFACGGLGVLASGVLGAEFET